MFNSTDFRNTKLGIFFRNKALSLYDPSKGKIAIFTHKSLHLGELPKITALAITLNEADTLDGFLQSLDFVDEIVIVDSYSTDETVQIVSKHPKVTVHQRVFDDFSSQKNYAISKATHDWILFFDPDEAITPTFREEVLKVLKNPQAIAYYVRRQLYFMGKKIQYSGFQTDWVIRLFHKAHCQYNGNLVHETLEVQGATARLKTRIPHYTYKSFEDYTAKLDRYNSLQARMLYKRGKKAHFWHLWMRPAYRFWHQYLLRLGILDGKEGFILAKINAHSVFNRYAKLMLLQRGQQ